ncbi:hypothetical protein [Mucilaginibacter sp. FT3.2]|uniref:hypothetical protein n=1 Tax=Mucilaginibacter sp. FT3.2 TaxID=2723090 RepID=UPI00160CBE69|nr:hypothetical protein [Mucilaginibacter sp. FT3.2]MBB6233747.1 heme/copper-type cytochrome/quinol oxidase subunit 4 [Mucilaginibacter sp. FT3.2]
MKFWKLLLLTYLFSVLLSIVLGFIWMLFTVKGQWDNHLVLVTIAGAFFLNLPLTFIEIPGLFMSLNFKRQKKRAFVVCFITPVVILGYVVFGFKLQYADKVFYASNVVSQILVLAFMFFRGLTPNNIIEGE